MTVIRHVDRFKLIRLMASLPLFLVGFWMVESALNTFGAIERLGLYPPFSDPAWIVRGLVGLAAIAVAFGVYRSNAMHKPAIYFSGLLAVLLGIQLVFTIIGPTRRYHAYPAWVNGLLAMPLLLCFLSIYLNVRALRTPHPSR